MRLKIILITLLLLVTFNACQNGDTDKEITNTPSSIELNLEPKIEYEEYLPKNGEDIFFSPGYSTYNNYLIYSSQTNGKTMYGFMDMNFNKLTQPISEKPPLFHNGLAYIISNGKHYAINEQFEELNVDCKNPFLYESVWLYREGISEVVKSPGKEEKSTFTILTGSRYGKIDIDEVLIRYKYIYDLWGYKTFADVYENITPEGDGFVIEPIYESASNFSEGLAAIQIDDMWGYIDESGSIVIECEYDDAGSFIQGVAFVSKLDNNSQYPNPLYYLIDKNGVILSDTEFTHVRGFYEGIAAVNTKEGGVLIDRSGEVLYEVGFRVSYGFKDGIALVIKDDDYFYINNRGENITGETYMFANEFNDGYALVYKKGMYGYINEDGLYAIEPSFKVATDFRSGYAAVKETKDGDGYIIDKLGNKHFEELNLSNISTFNEDGYALGYSEDSDSGRIYYLIHSY